jgi:hypothetical protein
MRKYIIITLIVVLSMNQYSSFAQTPDMSVPDSIMAELTNKVLSLGGSLKMEYKVVYPANYDSTKTYPMMLGLSGGDQNEDIVNYCYYAWFRSDYFNDYISIIPLAPKGQNFLYMNTILVNKFFSEIVKVENISDSNWVMVGTSNGGAAAFNFLKLNVAPFSKLAVIPGELQKVVSSSEGWGHLDVVLALGSEDKKWKPYTDKTYLRLKPVVKSVEKVVMEGEGHLVSADYDMDIVYKVLFDKKD